jgi:hypothetical protein
VPGALEGEVHLDGLDLRSRDLAGRRHHAGQAGLDRVFQLVECRTGLDHDVGVVDAALQHQVQALVQHPAVARHTMHRLHQRPAVEHRVADEAELAHLHRVAQPHSQRPARLLPDHGLPQGDHLVVRDPGVGVLDLGRGQSCFVQ